MKRAIFLDRDGVIIENRSNYVRSWEDVEIFPSAVAILSRISSSPYQIILVTNQSAVGRGLISLEAANQINQQLIEKLHESGCRIDGVFMCPHAPDENCSCRKPRPGLLLEAAESLQVDLSRSMMIGDAWTDLQAGYAAGITRLGLVLTGRGYHQLQLQNPQDLRVFSVYKDLTAALQSMISLK